MSKILVANIGNRTLIETNHGNTGIGSGQKAYIDPNGKEHYGTFRYLTKLIWDNSSVANQSVADSWLGTVQINIIGELIEQNIDDLVHIYFFVSNQEGKDKNTGQDTLYAGALLKKLILKKYPTLKISIIEIKAWMIDANELIPIYRRELLKIKELHKEKIFIFCDSGGTPQQKTSMKIMVEYLLKGKNYEYKQVIPKPEHFDLDKIVEVKPIEYSKIIADENIILLCKQGAYQGAKWLRASVVANANKGENIYNALNFWELRMNRLSKNAKMLADGLPPGFKKKFATIQDYAQDKPVGNNYEAWKADLHKEDYFQLCEILSIAQYYWFLKDWSNAVLTYQIFMENYGAFFIKKKKGNHFDLNHPIARDRNWAKSRLKNELANYFTTIQPYLPDRWTVNEIAVSLPTQTAYCAHVLRGNHQHNAVINSFKNLHGDLIRIEGKDGIDELRNAIVHKGIGIATKGDINLHITVDFETVIHQWNIAFDLPNENVFIKSNREIEDFLRNQ